jgi:hypothetical protein
MNQLHPHIFHNLGGNGSGKIGKDNYYLGRAFFVNFVAYIMEMQRVFTVYHRKRLFSCRVFFVQMTKSVFS